MKLCDFCGDYTKPNDQNDVALNGAKYMLCKICYQNICGLFSVYNGSGKKFNINLI